VILIDTDVVSYLFKGHPLAKAFAARLEGNHLCISFVTLAEIEFGMRAAQWGSHRTHAMRAHLAKFEVIQSNPDLCRMWAAVMSESTSKGRRMSQHDAWIAAAAIHLNASLATNNVKDFRHLDRLKFLRP
jgi:predicted nucleic acid-binding protein